MASSELLDELLEEITGLKKTIEDARSAALQPETVDNVVELALLRSFSLFEHFLEEFFYLCLLGDSSVSGAGPLVVVTDRAHADLLLRSTAERTLPFLSWLPLARLLDAADRFLAPGHPFERLRYRETETTAMIELTTVRNAVAHPDSPAMAKFEDLGRRRGYPPGRPARYLLSTRAGALEVLLLMTRVEMIARGIQATHEDAGAFLEPERPFTSEEKAPSGEFECRRCGAVLTHPGGARLGPCTACEDLTPCATCGQTPRASSLWERRASAP